MLKGHNLPCKSKSNKLILPGLIVLAAATVACASSASNASTSTQVIPPDLNNSTLTPLPTQGSETIQPADTIQAASTNMIYHGVILVKEDDRLNVRSGPGVANDIVTSFNPIFAAIEITDVGVTLDDGTLWVPIKRLESEGWVNRYFLTEIVTADTFCADLQVETLLQSIRDSIASDNGSQLANLVHPQRGLLIRLNWWNEEVRLTQNEINIVFSDLTSRDWGIQDGSGNPINGTASEVIIPLLKTDILAAQTVTTCNEIMASGTAGLVTIPYEYAGMNYYSFHRPPPNQEDGIFDWGTWVIGIEYWEGQPYLAYLIHYQWEI